MDDEDWEAWDRLIGDLSLTHGLREYIEASRELVL